MITAMKEMIIVYQFKILQSIRMNAHFKLRKLVSLCYFIAGQFAYCIGVKASGTTLLLKARRVYAFNILDDQIKKILINHLSSEYCNENSKPVFDRSMVNSRVIVLKLPRIRKKCLVEKGVLLIKFTSTFRPVFQATDIKSLTKYFRIVLEPSWVGYSMPEILTWYTLSPERIVVMSPYFDDYNFIKKLNINLVPTTLGPSDWVRPSIFYKIPTMEKKYDAIYVANYNPVKRVDRFVKAIESVSKIIPDYRAAIVCAGHGSSKYALQNIINRSKYRSNIEFFSGMSQEKLNVKFNESKVNILISLREGSNKGLAEGLFSGAPCLMTEESANGNRLHINRHTGKIVKDSELEEALIWFRKGYSEYSPETWVNINMDPKSSTKKLAQLLSRIDAEDGFEWTRNLMAKVNEPELGYLDPENSWLLRERGNLLRFFSKRHSEREIIDYLSKLESKEMMKNIKASAGELLLTD